MHTQSADNPDVVSTLVDRGRKAQRIFEKLSQRDIDIAVAAVGWRCYDKETAYQLCSSAINETDLGNVDDSYVRLRQRIVGTLRDLLDAVAVGVAYEDAARGIRKLAKPVGVITSITPATAPVAAVIVNALSSLKTRNAIIFCPNPLAARTVFETVGIVREALKEVGAPLDLVQCIDFPTRAISEELMDKADLVVASGGASTVRRAYRSGTPAFGAGVGNAVVIVDETADFDSAASIIMEGKSFDHGTSCSAESCVLIADVSWNALVDGMIRNGGYLCSQEQTDKLRRVIWPEEKTLARNVVGRSAKHIAELAGFTVPPRTRALLVTPQTILQGDPIEGEKLSPILALYKFEQFDQAVDWARSLISKSGSGHSGAIHSSLNQRIEQFARCLNVSRILVNQSTGMGNSGSFENGLPFSVTLSCGTWGGSSTTDNINWRHFLNYTWISEKIPRNEPRPEDLFWEYWSVHHPSKTNSRLAE